MRHKKKLQIKRIGHSEITKENVYRYIYKGLPFTNRLNKQINVNYLKNNSEQCQLIYHPFWLAKTVIVAERPPFPPRKTPNMIFVDAVSGYRGVFSSVPVIQKVEVNGDELRKLVINQEEEVKKYIEDVQQKQINRSYILKKPLHELHDLFLAYLPIWKVNIKLDTINKIYYVNGNTGELENFMANRWESREDLIS
ncbi:hypothetical protein ACLIA0_07440 [Bacillaceae bacterium W0354]